MFSKRIRFAACLLESWEYVSEWMGLNFQYYEALQPKIRAGIINEHECSYLILINQSAEVKLPFFCLGVIAFSLHWTKNWQFPPVCESSSRMYQTFKQKPNILGTLKSLQQAIPCQATKANSSCSVYCNNIRKWLWNVLWYVCKWHFFW